MHPSTQHAALTRRFSPTWFICRNCILGFCLRFVGGR